MKWGDWKLFHGSGRNPPLVGQRNTSVRGKRHAKEGKAQQAAKNKKRNKESGTEGNGRERIKSGFNIRIVPFGFPVVPDVKMTYAGSVGWQTIFSLAFDGKTAWGR